MDNAVVRNAVNNIRQTGATIRTQAPLLNNINNDSKVWAKMWRMQIQMGMVPYYMFVERETGPYDYFGLPLAEVYNIYREAIQQSSSFAKTITGPVMSASQGKVQILGIVESFETGRKYFKLQFVRHRDKRKTFNPFLAEYDEQATWFDQLNVAEEAVPVFSKHLHESA